MELNYKMMQIYIITKNDQIYQIFNIDQTMNIMFIIERFCKLYPDMINEIKSVKVNIDVNKIV